MMREGRRPHRKPRFHCNWQWASHLGMHNGTVRDLLGRPAARPGSSGRPEGTRIVPVVICHECSARTLLCYSMLV
jgi:hypothetical protein